MLIAQRFLALTLFLILLIYFSAYLSIYLSIYLSQSIPIIHLSVQVL